MHADLGVWEVWSKARGEVISGKEQQAGECPQPNFVYNIDRLFSTRPGSAQHFSGRWWTSWVREYFLRVATGIVVALEEVVQYFVL